MDSHLSASHGSGAVGTGNCELQEHGVREGNSTRSDFGSLEFEVDRLDDDEDNEFDSIFSSPAII